MFYGSFKITVSDRTSLFDVTTDLTVCDVCMLIHSTESNVTLFGASTIRIHLSNKKTTIKHWYLDCGMNV